jgi:hypothetical protein
MRGELQGGGSDLGVTHGWPEDGTADC